MLGALLHTVFDAISNLGVIVAGLVIWLTSWSGRFYLDPAIGLAISILILCSSVPFVKRTGIILLQSAPQGVVLDDIKHDIENVRNRVFPPPPPTPLSRFPFQTPSHSII
jgi:zinc transporter 1